MTWNQRFAIIDAHKPSDEQICKAFGVQQNELDTARQLRATGQFVAASDVDVDAYASMFSAPAAAATTTKRTSSTSTTKPTTDAKPLTATKKTKEPKKRGRKGDKIKNAFAAIPNTPVPADDFASKHGVSLTVLRQSKRFDAADDGGKVHVKKIPQEDGSKVLSIWRDAK
jgi:hypothetical protein